MGPVLLLYLWLRKQEQPEPALPAGRSTQPREEPGEQQWMIVPAFASIFSS